MPLLNSRDQWHTRAVDLQIEIQAAKRPIRTTEFVLMEIGDGLSAVRFRELAAAAIRSLASDELVTIVPATSALVTLALKLFESRRDKTWGLTDCSSFVVMAHNGITGALTTDDDFRQAGFNALMLK